MARVTTMNTKRFRTIPVQFMIAGEYQPALVFFLIPGVRSIIAGMIPKMNISQTNQPDPVGSFPVKIHESLPGPRNDPIDPAYGVCNL